jgi:phospholipid/cholesterol/gamma-HCH transport system substrate-binding protein
MNQERKTELLVGLFLTCGLLMLAGIILKFGQVRDLFRGTYTLKVRFDDATGIKASAPVMLGGDTIGNVEERPHLEGNFTTVVVTLKIFEEFKIPSDATFEVGTAGLVGDSYIRVRPSGRVAEKFYVPDDDEHIIQGTKPKGISEITDSFTSLSDKAGLVMDDMRAALTNLDEAMAKVNNGALSPDTIGHFKKSIESLDTMTRRVEEKILSDANADDLRAAIADLRVAAASFKQTAVTVDGSTKKIDALIDKLDPAVAKADELMASATATMNTAKDTMTTFHDGAKNFALLTKDMAKGEGLFRALMTDAELRNDFKALISNLKRNGIIWYDDDAEKARAQAEAKKQQESQQQRSGGLFKRR